MYTSPKIVDEDGDEIDITFIGADKVPCKCVSFKKEGEGFIVKIDQGKLTP